MTRRDAVKSHAGAPGTNECDGALSFRPRFLLRLKGIQGDKRLGIEQLTIVARGRYLRPIAKILLALAALREKQLDLARTQLLEFVAEFPHNPLFARELTKIGGPRPVPFETTSMRPFR